MPGTGNGYTAQVACDGIYGTQRYYMTGTTGHETCWVPCPHWIYDDFDGVLGGDPMDGTITYSVVEVNLNTAIAPVADQSCAVIGLLIDADNNAEDAVLYWGDQRSIDLYQHANIEFGLCMHVLPTGGAPATGVTTVFGLAHDHNLDKDTVGAHAWFRLQGAASLLCETDDTTNDNDDVDTGYDLVADAYHTFRIDCYDMTNVKFFFDGGLDNLFEVSNHAVIIHSSLVGVRVFILNLFQSNFLEQSGEGNVVKAFQLLGGYGSQTLIDEFLINACFKQLFFQLFLFHSNLRTFCISDCSDASIGH